MEIINNIKVNTESREMFPDRKILGVEGENEFEKLVFKLKDNNSSDVFFGGEARLETKQNDTLKYLVMETDIEKEEYSILLTNELLKDYTSIDLQIRIINENGTVFKSKSETFEILEGINATQEIDKSQLEWVDYIDVEFQKIKEHSEYAKDQGDYAKEQADIVKEELDELDNVVQYVTTTSEEAKETSQRAETIAKGRATGYVFDTLEDLDLWLQNEENTSKLVLGDNLYIRAVGVPDYWWDGTQKQELETQKVDLTEYVKNTDYATSSKAGVVKTNSNYGTVMNGETIIINPATNAMIDAKDNERCPIVPSRLDYAVGSVKASETQSGTAKMWTSENEDGEIGLNISTEV